MLVRGVGCHKLPVGVWGEAPAGTVFLHNETHSVRIIGNSWLDEPMGENIGYEGSSLSGGRAPQVGAYMSVWQLLSHYIWRPCPVASLP